MIYLDYAATSPALPEMFASQELFSSGCREMEQARAQITRLLCGYPAGVCGLLPRMDEASPHTHTEFVHPGEIIFTSGGTESDNLAILGTFLHAKREGRPLRLLTGATEHEAVLQAVHAAEEYGDIFNVDVKTWILPVTPEGAVDPERVRKMLKEIRAGSSRTKFAPIILVSIMYANNETGILSDVEKIGCICHEAGAIFHTDAVQAVGHVPMDLRILPVDMLSASAHKFGGPKGAGFLYVRHGIKLEPLFFGTGENFSKRITAGCAEEKDIQKNKYEISGTENALRPGAICSYGVLGMAQALEYRMIHLKEEHARIQMLRNLFRDGIFQEIPGVHVNGGTSDLQGFLNEKEGRLPGHLNVSFDGIESASLLFMLDMKGICASGGSACAAQSGARSHVLTAMSLSKDRIDSAIRFSLGPETTEEEIRETISIVKDTVTELRMLRR